MPVELTRRYAALWESSDSPPDVFAYLRRHSDALPSDKLSILLCDQKWRWQTDLPYQVEDYLKRVPDLAAEVDLKLQLVVSEFQARRNGHATPSIEEFTSRFTDLGDSLRNKLMELIGPDQQELEIISRTVTRTVKVAYGGKRIGRYRLGRLLGEGAFGQVFLCFDEELQRQVAIKVPIPERTRQLKHAEHYLSEARKVAGLYHPHIVPVYDVGRTEDGSVYVVSKFIEGCNLGQRIEQVRLTCETAAKIVTAVAQALHHAHQKRLIHRDIKPANILIEENTGTPYVADFGLAISDEEYLRIGKLAGTPAYMSPEQVRGEGHRLDFRCDIFSTGVVLYELLTGRRPFRGTTVKELFHQITSQDPVPPRDLDNTIPVELERVCLKALSKRVSDRYATAADLADDLSCWDQSPRQSMAEQRVVPKGLRSFDADDSDFFIDLLPGPRNRAGLPDSIQFWKARIEATDPDQTFRVGLLYGPSGCGKSSLVKAGLLPRLSKQVIAIYLEATPEETEMRILQGLRKRLPELSNELGLVETFATLRLCAGKKVIILIDQFEQWLHSHRDEQNSELVNALRQCDGLHVQAIVMVRDEFWLKVSRFMDALDVPINQGQNIALVDLFDIAHARKLLTVFGRAFDKLPAQSSCFTEKETKFISSAASGLARDGKVVSVRLSLFAEMIKGKPWTPATLDEVGGTEGIGVNFLEETFCSRRANPRHRLHQQAARTVLASLLPEVGTDIKGNMQSHAKLLVASGYQERASDFSELLHILDGELRLITPTDPIGVQDSGDDPGSKCYQLTHDYLVPSLRDWLNQKQRETRRGRAELRLANRTVLWIAKPENRQLPSLWEYLDIWLLTNDRARTSDQRTMIRRARKVHGVRIGIAVAVLFALTMSGLAISHQIEQKRTADYAASLVEQLLAADIAAVPGIVTKLADYRPSVDPLLRQNDDMAAADCKQKLQIALALLPVDESKVNFLRDQLLIVTPIQFPVVRTALNSYKNAVIEPLWNVTFDSKRQTQQRFQAACALAMYSPDDERWSRTNTLVASHLVTFQAPELVTWREALRPVKNKLVEPLEAMYRDASLESQRRSYATETLADYLADQPDVLVDLLGDAEQFQFPVIYSMLVANKERAVITGQEELMKRVPEPVNEDEKEHLAKRQANLAVALMRLGHADNVWPFLRFNRDPRTRSYLVHWISTLGGDPQTIVKRLGEEGDVTIRRALVLCLGEFSDTQLPIVDRIPLIEKLLLVYENEPDAGLHSAAEWLLRKWGQSNRLQSAIENLRSKEEKLQNRSSPDKCQWYINTQGQTLVILDAGEFLMGSPESEPDRHPSEPLHRCLIGRRFAMSAESVTKAQFEKFQNSRPSVAKMETSDWTKTEDSPAVLVSWYEAAAYCNWLSEQDGVPQDQLCYKPNENGEYGPGMTAKDHYLDLNGYRLPTEAEFEYACRAGTVTSRYYGLSDALLVKYARFNANGQNRTWPVGSLKPNDYGLFDMHGNAWNWCDDSYQDYPKVGGDIVKDLGSTEPRIDRITRVLRGGGFGDSPDSVRSACRIFNQATRGVNVGFRPARTYPTQ